MIAIIKKLIRRMVLPVNVDENEMYMLMVKTKKPVLVKLGTGFVEAG